MHSIRFNPFWLPSEVRPWVIPKVTYCTHKQKVYAICEKATRARVFETRLNVICELEQEFLKRN